MRLLVPLRLVLAAAALAPALAFASPPAAGSAASRPVSFRPRAWQPPAAAARFAAVAPAPGMVEGSGPFPLPLGPSGLGRTRAEAIAGVKVEVRADGSRHAVLGGSIRAWSVASLGEKGELQMDCASSEAAAIAKARAASCETRASKTSATPAPRGGK